jgi:hypothetical protein
MTEQPLYSGVSLVRWALERQQTIAKMMEGSEATRACQEAKVGA